MPRKHPEFTTAVILAAFLMGTAPHVPGQSATPVAKLDPNRLIGTYYEISRYPIKREKQCLADEKILYALGDKRNSFQIVTSCEVKEDYFNYWDKKGKFDDAADGKLRLNWLWPFTTRYWILAIAPDYSWALVGTPNHKSLWILSHTPTLAPDVLSGIQSQATAQGFNTAKLISIPQHPNNQP
jgi:apolipoprotein D and lipocalin family protein